MEEKMERFPEQLALFALAFCRRTAHVLLSTLSEPAAERARQAARRLDRLCAEDRRVLVSLEFGVRPDADARLRRVVSPASGPLRRALFQSLPSYLHARFPDLDATRGAGPPPSPLVRTFAARRVREAVR